MRINEHGITYRFGASFNMSSNTGLELTFTKPSGATLVVDKTSTPNAVSLETSSVSTSLGTFAANESVKYTFKAGDVDEAGEWNVQLKYTDANKVLISDKDQFTVDS